MVQYGFQRFLLLLQYLSLSVPQPVIKLKLFVSGKKLFVGKYVILNVLGHQQRNCTIRRSLTRLSFRPFLELNR
jgi:hypothetical protein